MSKEVRIGEVKNIIYDDYKTYEEIRRLYYLITQMSNIQLLRTYEHLDTRRLYCECVENYEECVIMRDLQIEVEGRISVYV